MLQIVATLTSFALAGSALTLIATTLSSEADAILGALRRTPKWAPVGRERPVRVRLASMPAPVSGPRTRQRAYA